MITSPDHAWTGFTLPSLIESRNLIDVTFCSSPCFSTANLPFHCQQHWVISAEDQFGLESLVKLGPKINFSPEARPTSLWFSLSWRWGDTFRILHMLHVDATPCCAPPQLWRGSLGRWLQGKGDASLSSVFWNEISQSCLNLMKWWSNKKDALGFAVGHEHHG